MKKFPEAKRLMLIHKEKFPGQKKTIYDSVSGESKDALDSIDRTKSREGMGITTVPGILAQGTPDSPREIQCTD